MRTALVPVTFVRIVQRVRLVEAHTSVVVSLVLPGGTVQRSNVATMAGGGGAADDLKARVCRASVKIGTGGAGGAGRGRMVRHPSNARSKKASTISRTVPAQVQSADFTLGSGKFLQKHFGHHLRLVIVHGGVHEVRNLAQDARAVLIFRQTEF